MQVIRETVQTAMRKQAEPAVVVLGNFDGVYRGHRLLLEQADQIAKRQGLLRRVLTFAPHPKQAMGQEGFKLIYEEEQKIALMKETGLVDELILLTFDQKLQCKPAKEFFASVLQQRCHAQAVVVGDNFRFGRGGEGDAALLQGLCEESGKQCAVVSRRKAGDIPISSSRIRTLLEAGQLEEAALLLGRPYFVEGTVKKGKQLGQKMQTPTINIPMEEKRLAPKSGVYISKTYIGKECFPSISNVGHNPTVGGESLRTETHILDFSGDLYGCRIRVELLKFLRPEIRFESVEALYYQLAKDVKRAKDYFLEENHEEI